MKRYILTGLLSFIAIPCFAEPPGFEKSIFAVLTVIVLIATLALGLFLKYLLPKFNISLPNWAVFVTAFILCTWLAIAIL